MTISKSMEDTEKTKNKIKDDIEQKSKRALGLYDEFKEFVTSSSVVDLTIGVVLGAALGRVVTSFVGDILMPLISLFFGGLEFKNLAVTIGGATINYGNFITNVVDFLIVAATVFFFIKFFAHMREKFVHTEEKSGKEDANTLLLTEIRDALTKSAD